MSERSEIIIPDIAQPLGSYPHVHIAEGRAFISGTGPRTATGSASLGDFAVQRDQTIQTLHTIAKGQGIVVTSIHGFVIRPEYIEPLRRAIVTVFNMAPHVVVEPVTDLPGGIMVEMKGSGFTRPNSTRTRDITAISDLGKGEFKDQWQSAELRLHNQLQDLGHSLNDVVDAEIRIPNLRTNWELYNKEYSALMAHSPKPARTTIGHRQSIVKIKVSALLLQTS